MRWPRNFMIAFSQISAFWESFVRSRVSSASPAVFVRWLWQVTQY